MKQLLVGFCFCVLMAAGFSVAARAEEAQDHKARAAERDRVCYEELTAPNHAEARQWLSPRQTSHIGFEVSREQMLEWTEQLYKAGAAGVYVTGIEPFGAMEISASMVVVLPKDDPDARRRVFEWHAAFSREMLGEEPLPDVGQKYIWLGLD